MAPLDVTGYGTIAERGDVSEDERALMAQAADENLVVVAEVTPNFGDA